MSTNTTTFKKFWVKEVNNYICDADYNGKALKERSPVPSFRKYWFIKSEDDLIGFKKRDDITNLELCAKLLLQNAQTAEHPTAPTVENKEDSSSKGYFDKHKMTFTGVNAEDYLDEEDFLKYTNQREQENKKLLEDNRKLNLAWDCDKAVLKELQDKLTYYEKKSIAALEDNKLLRDALQKINNIEDGAFGLSNFDGARFKKDIQQALEQTK